MLFRSALVRRWEAAIDRFVFWALVYELLRHGNAQHARASRLTIFDVMDYTLTAQEIGEALELLRLSAHGAVKPRIGRLLELMIRNGFSWQLDWLTELACRCWGALNR